MKSRFWLVRLILACLTTGAAAESHAAPADILSSLDYQVNVGDRAAAVYTARVLDPPFDGSRDYGGPYSFCNFDVRGRTAVRVCSKRSLEHAVLRPAVPGVTTRVLDPNTLLISLPGPCKLSLEPDGNKSPLLLFANPVERPRPRAGAPRVLYFGPGVHRPERIVLTNHQTLYLADGAVVKAGVQIEGRNIRVAGRGILDGSDWEWRKGPTPHVVMIRGTNVEVSGITIRGAFHWTIVPRNSRNVTIRNVKICGSRVQNDDGINPCNSQRILIRDCFIRSDDDCVALKGLASAGPASNVEDIRVENCTLWCDRARVFLLGHESRAPFMRNITLRNLDIIHFVMTPFLFEPGEEMSLENVSVEQIRIHGEGQRELIRLQPVVNQYMRARVPGMIRDVRFRHLQVFGKPGPYLVQLSGADETHRVGDVVFEDVEIAGRRLHQDSERLAVGQHVHGLRVR